MTIWYSGDTGAMKVETAADREVYALLHNYASWEEMKKAEDITEEFVAEWHIGIADRFDRDLTIWSSEIPGDEALWFTWELEALVETHWDDSKKEVLRERLRKLQEKEG